MFFQLHMQKYYQHCVGLQNFSRRFYILKAIKLSFNTAALNVFKKNVASNAPLIISIK